MPGTAGRPIAIMTSIPQDTAPDGGEYDPVYLNARREAVVIFGVWVVCLLWSVPYCYIAGFPKEGQEFLPETLSTVGGIPSWVFWGILFPWVLATLFTTWFCFFYMVDDDLGEANEGADIQEEIEELHAAEQEGGQ